MNGKGMIAHYERTCQQFIERSLDVTVFKLKNVESLDDVLKQTKPGGGKVNNPVWIKLKTEKCIHVVTIYNNMIFEPSAPFALEATHANLDAICGGKGTCEGVQWARSFSVNKGKGAHAKTAKVWRAQCKAWREHNAWIASMIFSGSS